MKYLRIIGVFSLSCIITNLANAQSASSCCSLPGWTYVRPIEINNTGNPERTNYQVLLVLDTELPISEGKMNADGSDIRFAISPCGQLLNYWIEDDINTTTTEIWVLMPTIPANSTEVIYMYYGNPSAPSTSSFPDVFTNVLIISSTQILNGNQSAEWVDIQAGAVVYTTSSVSFTARKIIVAGEINGDNMGYRPAQGPGTGGNGSGDEGGGGGGYGGKGGHGGGAQLLGFGGPTYGTDSLTDIDMGSGGARSDCLASGAGGGAVRLEAASIDINGGIYMRGQTADFCCCLNNSEAAGGGSGGGILLIGDYIEGNGVLSAKGGKGGESDTKEGGGGGGGGRIKLFSVFANAFTGTTNVNGGLFGPGGQCCPQAGARGTVAMIDLPDYITIYPERPIQVFPVADFSSDLFCLGTPAIFNDSSTIAMGTITDWSWDFGDAQTSVQQSPSHNYAAENTYTVTLTVNSDSACSHSITKQVTVHPSPAASFSCANVCSGAPVNFIDESTINIPHALSSWSWNFGDGQISNQQSPSHTYQADGTYTVTLIVISDGGCADTTTRQVTVYPTPVAAFTSANVCFGAPVNFMDASTVNQPAVITSWSWNCGDGQTLSQQNLTHNYTTDGTFTVTLAVATGNCADTTTHDVIVHPVPVAAFNLSDVCFGEPVNFTDACSVDSPSVISSWSWNFGDGTQMSTQRNPTNNYAVAGRYNVTLTVATNANCVNALTKTVNVFPSLNVNLIPINVLCAGAASGEIQTSIIGGTPRFNFHWSNNASTSTLINLSGGTYAVTVTDVNTCSATGSTVITEPANTLTLTGEAANVTCFGSDDGSIDLTAWGGTSPYTYAWSNNATGAFISGLPAGDYSVTVTDEHGCACIKSFTITQPPQLILNVFPPDTTLYFGVPFQYSSLLSPVDANAQYTWTPAGNLSCWDCPNPDVSGIGSFTYHITATSNGCTTVDTAHVEILIDKVLYIPNAFTPNGDGVNDVFYVYTHGDKRIKIQIFDRWGSLIFTSTDSKQGWDGTSHGQIVNPGVFVYDAYIEYLDRTVRREHGSVTVIE